jgi:hypothetical protein
VESSDIPFSGCPLYLLLIFNEGMNVLALLLVVFSGYDVLDDLTLDVECLK